MLKFYTVNIQHPNLVSSYRGQHFVVTDGRYMAGYNEAMRSTVLFGHDAIPLYNRHTEEGAQLDADVKAGVQDVLTEKLCDYQLRFEAAQEAAEIVRSMGAPVDVVSCINVDRTSVKRVLCLLYRRLFAWSDDVYQRCAIEARVNRIIDSFMLRAEPNTPTLTAHYKGENYSQAAYKAIRLGRKFVAETVRNNIRNGDCDTDELLDDLRHLHAINNRIVTNSALERYEHLGFGQIVKCDCGHLESVNNVHDVRNDFWCDLCFDENTVYVEDLCEYWPREDAHYHECDDRYYSYAEPHDDYDGYDGDDEDDDCDPQDLMSYSTNVLRYIAPDKSIESSPFGNFTMGVELEMCAGSRSSVDEAVLDVRTRLGEDYVICKSDGSLPSDGFEVVTAPRGLDEHIRRFKAWEVKPAYRAWNAKQCGLHVHIDSRAFTQMTLGKFLMFINDDGNADFIRSLAGRHPKIDDQARHYCAAEKQSIIVNPLSALKGKDSSRYRMVNVTNMDMNELTRLNLSLRQYDTSGSKFNTVELRIFRASLKKERLLAQIEFAHAAVMFVRSASYRDLTEGAFKGWLAKAHVLYPHLAAWYEVAPKKKANPNVAAVVASDETVA